MAWEDRFALYMRSRLKGIETSIAKQSAVSTFS